MKEELNALRDFLEGIPQFLRDQDLDCEFIAIKRLPGVACLPYEYSVDENAKGDGFNISGKMAPVLLDLLLTSNWYTFKNAKGLTDDEEAYPVFLRCNPNLVKDFSLEDFVEFFNDYYLDFLNDAGIAEDALEIDGNSIRFSDAAFESETVVDQDDDDDDDSDDEET